MKRKNNIIMGVILIIIVIGANSCINKVFKNYGKQIKSGYIYLNKGNYDDAIKSFEKAIKIGNKKDKAYIALADTYIERGNKDAIDDANNILKEGYIQTKSDEIISSYLENAGKLIEDGNVDLAIDLLDKGFDVTKDDRLSSKKEELLNNYTSIYKIN